jgi:hypothetical protein
LIELVSRPCRLTDAGAVKIDVKYRVRLARGILSGMGRYVQLARDRDQFIGAITVLIGVVVLVAVEIAWAPAEELSARRNTRTIGEMGLRRWLNFIFGLRIRDGSGMYLKVSSEVPRSPAP